MCVFVAFDKLGYKGNNMVMECETGCSGRYDPKMYVNSTWTPPHWTIPPIALEERLSRFSAALNKLFKTCKGKTNLLPHQHRALRTLQQQQAFLIVPCDKNLGPTIIERHDYLKIAMQDHLSDTTTYKSLTTSEIDRYSSDITKNILGWLKTHHKTLTKMERAFLRKKLKSNQSPYARFYLTLKAHKLKPGQMVDQLKSRPIVSCPGSLLHGLGVWRDQKLQEVAQRTVSYFKNTLELKKELLDLNLPTNARLFTAEAVSMYTNIPTHTALNLIGKYLNQHQQKYNNKYPKDAVRAGLRLIMTMNIFTFGDLTLKQLNGTAMGTPPAPPYATIYYGIHEEKFLPHHAQCVIFYRQFIDDVIGIWCLNNNHEQDALEWDDFKNKMNTFPGLTWEFSEQAKSTDFMDMTISINNPNTISPSYSNTALFCPTNPHAKKMTFEFLLRFSVFYFLFSATTTGFLTFCLPADEATAKSVTKTAVVCKYNRPFFLTKPSLCQKPSTLVKTPPVLVLLATLTTVHV